MVKTTRDQSANAIIKGYYYQADTTILKFLLLESNDAFIDIELLEDIDIHSVNETIYLQVKYLSLRKYSNTAIRPAVIKMLNDIKNKQLPSDYRYRLYIHFESELPGTTKTFDIDELKKLLTYTKRAKKAINGKKATKEKRVVYYLDYNISDSVLAEFAQRFTLEYAEEFDKQQRKVREHFRKLIPCTEYVADAHYYNNALRVVLDFAKEKNGSNRRLTKAEFLQKIDTKGRLFNEWYIERKSKTQYLAMEKAELRLSKSLAPSREKLIIIGKEILDKVDSTTPFSVFVENLVNNFYHLGKEFSTALPILLVLEESSDRMHDYKKSLIEKEISFNDGYEHIAFSPKLLNKNPIINHDSRTGKRIAKSSFRIKILSLSTLLTFGSEIKLPKTILHFSNGDYPLKLDREDQFFDFKYFNSLKEINALLTP